MTKDQLRLIGLPDRRAALKGFARATSTFDDMDVIHSEARSRMLDRLPFFELKPRRVLDLGSELSNWLRYTLLHKLLLWNSQHQWQVEPEAAVPV